MDRKVAGQLLVEFDDAHAAMEEILTKIADAADIDQDIMRMKHDEFKDWLYRAFEERFNND